VLCGRPSYDPSERHPFYLLRRERQGNLIVERVGSITYPRFRMRQRLLNYLSYLVLAVPRALMIPADVVLSMTDPPIMGIAAAFVAMLKRRPFVYNIRDMYPDMALGGEIMRPSRFVNVWEKLHRWALRRAAKVIVLGEDMRPLPPGSGVVGRLLDCPPLDRGDTGGNTDHDPWPRPFTAMDLLDEVTEHLLGDVEVRDDTVSEGADRGDVGRGAADHPLCFHPDRKGAAVLSVDGDH